MPAKWVSFFQDVAKQAKDSRETPQAKEPKETNKLSPQELTVLELISSGYINKEIADKMGVSLATVKTYVERIYSKMHVHSRVEALNKLRSK